MQAERTWLVAAAREREAGIEAALNGSDLVARIEQLTERNRQIHDFECINLNPASNVMNPRAEALMSAGLGTRASLGHAGDKYEMGLEAIEEIEVITAALARQVFNARFAEIRVGSGGLANLYTFMATCKPGDTIVVPPPSIGGHITHNTAGAAGLYGLNIVEAPIDASRYTVDLPGLRDLVHRARPALVTIGGSLNLLPHPVREVKAIADEVGAPLLFDAAHACGMFAGRQWPSPLDEGADIMTMSTYKSLGGPPSGLVLTNRADLAERIDAIAYPGLTANFDVAKTAALGVALNDWLGDRGPTYGHTMTDTARRLAHELAERGLPVFGEQFGYTTSHQLALDGTDWGGGHQAALRLREANLLTCAIGLPGIAPFGGLRIGTPEIVRWGMTAADMPELANLIDDALSGNPTNVAKRTSEFRQRFQTLHHIAP
jgi:glycine hydroxymethyltransferase